MEGISVEISYQLGRKLNDVGVDLQNDILVADLIRQLITELALPESDSDGRQLCYRLGCKELGRELLETETPASAKIATGNHLFLTASSASDEKYTVYSQSAIKLSAGIRLDGIPYVEFKNLLRNETALLMTLHRHTEALSQAAQYQQECEKSREEIDRLRHMLKDKNTAAVLLILGQILIGFGTNLVTDDKPGGWIVFGMGLLLNVGGLYFSIFGGKIGRSSKEKPTNKNRKWPPETP